MPFTQKISGVLDPNENTRPKDGIWWIGDNGRRMIWLGDTHPVSRLRFDVKAAIIAKSDKLCTFLSDSLRCADGFSAMALIPGLANIITGSDK